MSLAMESDTTGNILSREQIVAKVDEILSIPSFRAGADRERLIRELETLYMTWAENPTAIGDDTDGHEPWLDGQRGSIRWLFWSRYKTYLVQRAKLNPAAVENLDRVTDEVLGRLEHPQREGSWDRRGLVMGHVQSGKTAAYTGLVCKAADAGYKVIIVLAGLHNNLRSQTQIRLDEGFLGYKAVPPGKDAVGFEKTGVAEFGPGLRADSVTNRHENGDFNKRIAKHFGIHPGGNPLLFVVKKNVTVLKNLLGWINHSADSRDGESGRKFHRNIPVLVIDDEADQASVDTKSLALDENGLPNEEHNPTKTNELIRRLLFAFDRSAYVGFTATPFANIFIHERARTVELGDDLFPRSFIINLPAPSNYTGAARIFGIQADSQAGLIGVEPIPITRVVADHAASPRLDETTGWMPPRLREKTSHVPLFNGQRAIPPSLRQALMAFLLSTCVRQIREPGPKFNSMLVHVVRFTNVQAIVQEEIESELGMIKDRLLNGDGTRKPSIAQEFSELWLADFIPTSATAGTGYALPEWDDVFTLLKSIVQTIKVRSVNGSSLDALDYEQHRTSGLNIVVIGGDKLSRGLTLEGLTVSYFLRSSRMYDTLMQMGRWFGYREKYLDVCRLYTSADLAEWFRHIAASTEELRLEFDHMVNVGASPREYGLRVRAHPALLVTSAVKMRSGTRMHLSYSGDISETVIFDTSLSVRQRNLKAVNDLLGRLPGANGKRAGGYLWTGVKYTDILDFFGAYDSHRDSRRADVSLLSQYIQRQCGQGELVSWTVQLSSSGLADATRLDSHFGGLEIGGIFREPLENGDQDGKVLRIRRLVSPADEAQDLTDPGEKERALAETHRLWQQSLKKNKSDTAPDKPSGRGIRSARPKERGMLIIYPLDYAATDSGDGTPVIGIAVSFPQSDTAREITYTVNNVFAEAGDYDEF